jgi:exopolyphosphatase/guanosine-5'-triphosphate,3'-diphosphate pyrophosphatase
MLPPEDRARAETLGLALRLAYTLSAGTPDLLAGTSLAIGAGLTLTLTEGTGVFEGEGVSRRLDRLAQSMRLPADMALAET